jgi:hypothetical protein
MRVELDRKSRRPNVRQPDLATLAVTASSTEPEPEEAWSKLPKAHSSLELSQRKLAKALSVFQNPLEPDDVPALLAAFREVQLRTPHVNSELLDRTDLFKKILQGGDTTPSKILEELEIKSKNPSRYIPATVRNQIEVFERGLKIVSVSDDRRAIFEEAKRSQEKQID